MAAITTRFDVKWNIFNEQMPCCGEWVIRRNNVNVSELIPEKLRHEPMDTYGRYSVWGHSEDKSYPEMHNYPGGLKADEWIAKNREWIDEICFDETEERQLYDAISAHDWRYHMCGKCVV